MTREERERIIINVQDENWIDQIDFSNENVIKRLAQVYGVVLGDTVQDSKQEVAQVFA